LSMPVGFKNATSGAVVPAINGIKAAMQPQTFLGINEEGRASMVTTTGNKDCHLILRGGEDGPNHDPDSVADTLAVLRKNDLAPVLMVDASHANCGKDCGQMPDVFREIVRQRSVGTRGIIGAMLESNLVAGAQTLKGSRDSLVYGQSITDSCIDWATTVKLLHEAARASRIPEPSSVRFIPSV
jgi:3-deoxy-7-phosphoheptulonate synthase